MLDFARIVRQLSVGRVQRWIYVGFTARDDRTDGLTDLRPLLRVVYVFQGDSPKQFRIKCNHAKTVRVGEQLQRRSSGFFRECKIRTAHASGFIEHDDHCHGALRSLRVECYREDPFNFRLGVTSVVAIIDFRNRLLPPKRSSGEGISASSTTEPASSLMLVSNGMRLSPATSSTSRLPSVASPCRSSTCAEVRVRL